MTDPDSLFPDLVVPAPVPDRTSAGRRLTLRQHAQVAAGVHPLTGLPARPELGTCGGCAHRIQSYRGYPKCDVGDGARITGGPATDCRAWWPACGQFLSRVTGHSG